MKVITLHNKKLENIKDLNMNDLKMINIFIFMKML